MWCESLCHESGRGGEAVVIALAQHTAQGALLDDLGAPDTVALACSFARLGVSHPFGPGLPRHPLPPIPIPSVPLPQLRFLLSPLPHLFIPLPPRPSVHTSSAPSAL